MNPRRLYERVLQGSTANVRFSDVTRLIEALAYELRRVRGDHHLFKHPRIEKKLNLQPDRGGQAKPYQVGQVADAIRRYDLQAGGLKMRDYAINVFWSEADGCYIATVPDLEGCSAFGDSPEAAVHEVQRAKELWLEVAREDGESIPEPRYLPPEAHRAAAG